MYLPPMASAEKFPGRGAMEKTRPKNRTIKPPFTLHYHAWKSKRGTDPLSLCRRPCLHPPL